MTDVETTVVGRGTTLSTVMRFVSIWVDAATLVTVSVTVDTVGATLVDAAGGPGWVSVSLAVDVSVSVIGTVCVT